MSIPPGLHGTFVVGDPNDTPADGDVLAYDAAKDLYTAGTLSLAGMRDDISLLQQAVADLSSTTDLTGVVKTVNGATPDASGNVDVGLPDAQQITAMQAVLDDYQAGQDATDTAVASVVNGTGQTAEALVTTYGARSVANAPTTRAPATTPTWLTTFQPGHGWASHSPTALADDTAMKMMGGQSVSVPAGASAQRSGLGLDLTGRQLAVWLRVEDFGDLSDLLVYAGAPGLSSFFVWRVIRGTDPTPWFRAGEWVYVTLPFPPDAITGTPDRAAIDTVRVTPIGGRVWVNAVGHTPDTSKAWPTGVVSVTFDDGYSSDVAAARDVMTPRGVRGTSFIIVDRIGAAGFMSEAEIIELGQVHGWDIEAHGLPDYTTLTDAELRAEFAKTKGWITARGLGRAEHMAYPMGFNDERVARVASEFFTTSRTIAGHSRESWPPADPHRLRAATSISSASGGRSVASVKAMIDQAVADGNWLILVFHRIVWGTPASTMECSAADLAEICDYLNASQAEVRTVAEVAAERGMTVAAAPEPAEPAEPQTTYHVKAADQVVNNSTTLVADDGLTFPVVNGGIYHVRGFVIYSTDAAADLKLGWTYPNTPTTDSQWSAGGPAVNATSVTTATEHWARTQINGTATIGGVDGGIGARLVARPEGFLRATADGTMTLAWAQGTATPTDSTVYAGSYLAVTKVN